MHATVNAFAVTRPARFVEGIRVTLLKVGPAKPLTSLFSLWTHEDACPHRQRLRPAERREAVVEGRLDERSPP